MYPPKRSGWTDRINMSEQYPRFQYSIFLKNGRDEQLVIRTETFEDLIEAKRDIDKILDKVEAKAYVPDIITPKCPKCGSLMVRRTSKKTGNEFWGCPKFPDCDGLVDTKKV